jgi:hypothetical protein
MTMRTFSGGGGSLQMYVPYSPTNGGGSMKVRFGNFDVSSGNSWTGWKTLLADDNYSNYTVPITGGTYSGPIAVNFSSGGNALSLTNATNGVQIGMYGNGANGGKTMRALNGTFEIVNSAYTAVIMSLTDAGVLAAPVVTQTSDERKKQDWRPLAADFVDRLASINRTGLFTWTSSGESSVGVGAQSLEAFLPESVHTDSNGYKTVNYGGAAMVSVVELARLIVKLQAGVDELEGGRV